MILKLIVAAAVVTATATSIAFAAPATPALSAARIRADVQALSSDDFGGRGPGEAGEAKTIAYLARAFAAAGFEPGGERGGWYQDVPLIRLDRAQGASMSIDEPRSFAAPRPLLPLKLGRDAALTLRNAGATDVRNAPLVFAGFGVVDRARGWDAYANVDMAGKIAVLLANDPDFEAGRDLGFEGRRMVYAGRVGAKVEAAARAGAIGALIIHEDAAASYPFSQVGSGDALPGFAVAPLTKSPLLFSGWLRRDIAVGLLREHGLTLEVLKARARNPGFRAFALNGATISVSGSIIATPVTSHNVIARLPGATRPREVVLYGAHWDANGTNGPDATGDAIRNGAVDNATGTAEALEIARAFAAGPRPARTVIIAAWTAEEKGLLGSDYYAAHPLYSLATTALVINLDPHVVLPAARDIELIGGGRTPVEGDLRRVAAAKGLRVDDEPSPEAGWYFRSDHYSFARRGVPAIAFRAGRDLIDGGLAAGVPLVDTYNRERYHQPSDQFDPAWTFAGTLQEASVAYALGAEVANSAAWSTWNAGSEYQPLRDASRGQRDAGPGSGQAAPEQMISR